MRFGLAGQITATALITATQYIPAASEEIQTAYEKLLGQNYIFVLGSLAAYYVSQKWDVYVFHRIRDWYIARKGSAKGGKWLWNNSSTITSQLLDTIVFVGISFGVGFGWLFDRAMWPTLLAMMLGQYLFKAVLAVLDTPFFYLLTRTKKQA